MRFFPLILFNLARRKLRTLLTVLSVLVAFLLYGYMSAIARALDQGVGMAGADRLLVRNRVTIALPLPEAYLNRIARQPGVESVSLHVWFQGIYQDSKKFFAQMATQPGEMLRMYPEYVLSGEALEAWMRTRDGAIVGRRTAERFGWKVGDRIPLQPTIWRMKSGGPAWEFELVGIYDGANRGTDDTCFYFRYDYLEESRSYGKGLVNWYMVKVRDPSEADAVARRIDAEFANSPWETRTETEGAFLHGWARQIGDITTIMVAILGAVFFTILLVAGNTMAQSVRERTNELGVLKAVGFSNGQVLAMVLGESCLLAGAGGGLGLGLAWWLISLGDPTGGALPMFLFPAGNVLVGVGLSFALGLATGILPATQAMRLRVAESLRR
jgi:putative ABC transport system permease protein